MKNISYLCNRFWAYEPNIIKVKAPVAELGCLATCRFESCQAHLMDKMAKKLKKSRHKGGFSAEKRGFL